MPATIDRPARILALCEGPIPSAVLGINAVFETLARSPAICALRTGSSRAASAEDLAWADTLILVRGASPAERRLAVEAQRLGKRVATYLDDDLERVPAEARSGYFFTSQEVRKNLAFIVRTADDVLVCSERLGDELQRRHKRTVRRILQPRPPRLAGERVPRPGEDPIRIGFLGSVDHGPFLDELLGDTLRTIQKKYGPQVEFVFCGPNPTVGADLGAQWRPFDEDFAQWRRTALELGISLGLAPLPARDFHHFKYWNKYLEYGSLGIAGVYSAVPPHADVVRDGETGILCANEPRAWQQAMEHLLDDAAERRRIGHAAYLDVEARFSTRALTPHWETVLDALLAHRARPCNAAEVRLRSGPVWHGLDRLAVYGPWRFTERLIGRLSGRLRPG